MKKILLFILLIICAGDLFSQETATKADYLRKAKNQNTTGWVFLGSGLALFTTGVFVGVSETNDMLTDLFSVGEVKDKNSGGGALLIGGGVVMLSSIPFFISSSHNRKKAATAFFKMETKPIVEKSSFVNSSFPSVGIRIAL